MTLILFFKQVLCGGLTNTYCIVVFNFRILLCVLCNVHMDQVELEYSEYSIFLRFFMYLLLQRGEREGEKYQCARDTWIIHLLLAPN